MGADVEGTIFAIVTCTMAPKTFSYSRSGATSNWDVKEASWGREDRTIVTELYYKRPVCINSILVEAIFGVDSSERRGGVGQSRGRDACE